MVLFYSLVVYLIAIEFSFGLVPLERVDLLVVYLITIEFSLVHYHYNVLLY